jgi:arylsulfatase A-like enzyme
MIRLPLLLLAIAMMVGEPCFASSATRPAAASRKPNVVFVMADQWRAAATGYAGDPNVKTPHLDRLASQSINFTNCISGLPVCTPCRASLLTGQRAITHGIFLNDAHLPASATTVEEVLKSAGYDTAFIGKWHLNGGGRLSFIPRADRQGFDYWKAMECTHNYNHSFYFADTPKRLEWDGYDAIAQTDDARKYIRQHAGSDKPFFLCLWWGPPHNPYGTAPDRFKAMYDPAKIQLRPNVPRSDEKSARKDLAGYYAHCSALDQCMGDLWQALRDSGIEQNTILVFRSDHGDMLESQGAQRKQKPWDESIRVPMLWHWPVGLGTTGKKVDAVMSSADFMPTLLGLCGVDSPKSVQGLNFSGYMKGAANPNRDNAAVISCISPFAEYSRENGGKEYRGVRTVRYTYVRDLNGPWLLYDDQADPYQQQNLINSPQSAELQASLDALLNKQLKASGDEFKPGDEYLEKWGYKDKVNKNGTLPVRP